MTRPPRDAPPWWPDGEPWRGRSWQGGRWRGGPWAEGGWRHGRRRFGCVFGLLFVLFIGSAVAFLIGLAAIALGLTGSGDPGDPLGLGLRIGGLLVLGAGVVGLLAGGRAVRAVAGHLDELADATRRVESGDYSVRVGDTLRGPRRLKQLARGFDTMAARLEADEVQRQSLLADVSHELRTPLAVVQGELEAIIDGVHAPDEAHLGAILDETRVLARLVDDLRTVALSEAGTLRLHREPTDVGLLAVEVATTLRTAAVQAGVTIEVNQADDLPLAELDPLRIREVLANLVTNAIRYTPRDGTVRISVAADGGGRHLLVKVRDTGRGIDPTVLPDVFERFVRSADSRGSGLGLAICRHLVEAHRGKISASTEPGGGTTMAFELPIRPVPDG